MKRVTKGHDYVQISTRLQNTKHFAYCFLWQFHVLQNRVAIDR